jgi:hypothetical protein
MTRPLVNLQDPTTSSICVPKDKDGKKGKLERVNKAHIRLNEFVIFLVGFLNLCAKRGALDSCVYHIEKYAFPSDNYNKT